METAIKVSSLRKSYKGVEVLKGLSFSVKKGNIFALLGSNGAGKTTAIKILSTLIDADEGSAEICGFDLVKDAHQVRQQISLTGQYAAVDEVLTGRENMRMIGSLFHLKNVNKKADNMLQRFQLMDAADRRVSTYSGGMRRRLDIGMSLMSDPKIIFLDEPTTGIDPQNRLSMWETIKELAATGITVFLTTQYLEEAEQLADYIAILNEGNIVAEGTPNELKKLLPYGYLDLIFHDEISSKKGYDLLKNFNPKIESITLTIELDEGIERLITILNILDKNNIKPSSFMQKLPTIEDVFLTMIGER